jgi:acyl CoA:acetate/3-ketoacid CoA transferase
MTAVHPTTFKQQVAKKKQEKKEEKFAKTEVHPLRYASGRTNKREEAVFYVTDNSILSTTRHRLKRRTTYR